MSLTSEFEETLKSARKYARDHLMRSDIQELMAIHRPPLELEVVLSVACMLLGMTEHVTEFRKCHHFLSAPETIRASLKLGSPLKYPDQLWKSAKPKLRNMPTFSTVRPP